MESELRCLKIGEKYHSRFHGVLFFMIAQWIACIATCKSVYREIIVMSSVSYMAKLGKRLMTCEINLFVSIRLE